MKDIDNTPEIQQTISEYIISETLIFLWLYLKINLTYWDYLYKQSQSFIEIVTLLLSLYLVRLWKEATTVILLHYFF